MAFVSILEFDGKQRDGGKPMLTLSAGTSRVNSSVTFRQNYFLTDEIEIDVAERVFRMKVCRRGENKKYIHARGLFKALGIPKDADVIRLRVTEKDGWLYSDKIQEFGNERQASDN